MDPGESSISKSVQSYSTSEASKENLIQGRSSSLDRVFPIYYLMMQKTKIPNFILYSTSLFLVFQIISVTFWIYTDPFTRTSPKMRNFYLKLFSIFAFGNPIDKDESEMFVAYITLGVSLFMIA
ncbi:hypothetical protein TVAG_017910 [Trichomonas vaginalis G3]|uniref:Uncharacterized protein n=1 Tax=Trichomonas vaginalis (strain ATCC PRA-98 / G3) TaxID=412133 RepID=A2FET0_TRIV3|nr:guanylate cyclase protein [Trichomonas vaginalis G3]EAX96577.1 hypothetical protein TVAG_017910 [Trichomonas vaginalis G3]KAI5485903.1 guanylate cyclase protein [Trichomonas vaginalis G3]|eukprot:XP_001309507.1 hypothetical protein [Trichomonas vaginalis G3]